MVGIREQISSDLQHWDAIENHRTGTSGDAATSEWLAGEIQAAGLAPTVDPFALTRRVPGLCEVANGSHRARGLPLFDGCSTPDDGISGTAGPLGSDAPIGVTEFGPNMRHPGSRALLAARRDNAHRAIVAISADTDVLPGLAVQNASHFRAPFGPPVLQVATEHADWLTQAAAAGTALAVHAELTDEPAEASNVQCRITGSQPSLAPLVVMTPKSAWWTCTAERGGGITVWLNLMRHFAGRRPARTVIFTANSGHELDHLGLHDYLERHPALLRDAHAWLHLGANFAARDGAVLLQASDAAWLRAARDGLTARGIHDIVTTPVGNRPLGEARNIHDGDGRYLSMIGSNRWFHHPADRWPDSVDLDKLLRINELWLQLARTLADA